MKLLKSVAGSLFLVWGFSCFANAGEEGVSENNNLVYEIYKEIIEIPSTTGSGKSTQIANQLAKRLLHENFPKEDIHLIPHRDGETNLVVRLRGKSKSQKPILLMAHVDVVPAVAEAWSTKPFKLIEKDGYYYARGSHDNKAGAAIIIANLIRYKREGFIPARDIIIALTSDEETTSYAIVDLVKEHRNLVDAEYALNTDSGSAEIKDGSYSVFGVQASEKVYLTFTLETENPGGHSSRPGAENAIYDLTEALESISDFTFPVTLDEVTRTFFERAAATKTGDEAKDMLAVSSSSVNLKAAARLSARSSYYNALLRTTCVPTRLHSGHADNALPRSASATVNCRIFPGHKPDEVEATLKKLAGEKVKISRVKQPTLSPASPLTPNLLETFESLVQEVFPGALLIPSMSTGATDGLYVRNAGMPVYGISALFGDPNDARAHGKDERVLKTSFYKAYDFWYLMVKKLSSEQ